MSPPIVHESGMTELHLAAYHRDPECNGITSTDLPLDHFLSSLA